MTAASENQDKTPAFELKLPKISVKAFGVPTGKNGMVVKAGSTARAQVTDSFQRHNYFNLRNTLIEKGRLVPTADPDLLQYAEDVVFDSASAAAAVCIGRSARGPKIWREVGTGQTYDDWKAGRVAGPMYEALHAPVSFEWTAYFMALANKLLAYHEPERQKVLLRILREAGVAVPFDVDQDLEVIDPFSFFSLVLKHKTDSRVQQIFTFIGEKLDIAEPAPTKTTGVPWSMATNALFFPYKTKRKESDLSTLWALARQAVDGNLEKETFEQALEIGQVGLAKLTQGLFWLNPFAFIPLNGVNAPYLDELGVSGTADVKTLEDYQKVLEQASDLAEDFPTLSHAAWVAAQEEGEIITPPDQAAPEVKFKAPPGVPLNQILYGPPGTGKTYSVIDEALKVLEPSFYSANKDREQRETRKERYDELVTQGKVTFVTFHQSFGYEDFIEGLKPVMKGEQEDVLAYERQDGLFLQAVRAAGGTIGDEIEQTPQAHVLIIDEINRGNVAKIFGELITLLEEGKRLGKAEGLTVQLPLSKRKFGVPESLYVIGTMNTADRSLTQLDAALRRRFTFKKVWPDPTLLPKDLKIGDETLDLQAFLTALNTRIEQRLSRDQMIGHAYLLGLSPTLEAVAGVLQNKILPLLEEYFFEDWNSIREVLGDDKKPNKADQFIHVTGDPSADRQSYDYNDEAFTRLSAFQQVYAKP